jgi:hypothetical protein
MKIRRYLLLAAGATMLCNGIFADTNTISTGPSIPLYTRKYNVPHADKLKQVAGLDSNKPLRELMLDYLGQNGVTLQAPAYAMLDPEAQKLTVRGTLLDLDGVEALVAKLESGRDPDSGSQRYKQAKSEEGALHRSSDVVNLTIWLPGLNKRDRVVIRDMLYKRPPGTPLVRWSITADDTMLASVRPQDLAFWQSAFCEITNRISWKQMPLELAAQDDCRLGDGSRLDFRAWQKWLDDSIAEGWSVGVSLVQSNHSVLLATRKKVEAGAQPGAAPNAAPQYQ